MANVQKKNARGHRREEKKAAARGTAPAPKKRTKAEQARWEQMELEAQAAAAKRQENISRIVDTFAERKEIAHFSHLADITEITENDFNLSVSTYVEAEDTREKIDIQSLCS